MRGQNFRAKGIPPSVTKRLILYGILCFLLAVIQCSFLARLRYLPATPDLILGAMIAVLLLDSREAGLAVGMVGGFLLDVLGGVGISVSPLLYLVIGTLAALMADKMLPRFWSWVLLMLPSLLVRELYGLIRLRLVNHESAIRAIWEQILLPESIGTLIFCLPLYGVIRFCVHFLEDSKARSLQ